MSHFLSRLFFEAPITRVIFFAFLLVFLLTAFVTLLGIAGFLHLEASIQNKLFGLVIAEVAVVMVALFRHLFFGSSRDLKIRLNFENLIDVRRLTGTTATCTFIDSRSVVSKNSDEEEMRRILDDNGPVITITPPNGKDAMLVSVQVDGTTYSGAISLDSRVVEMEQG